MRGKLIFKKTKIVNHLSIVLEAKESYQGCLLSLSILCSFHLLPAAQLHRAFCPSLKNFRICVFQLNLGYYNLLFTSTFEKDITNKSILINPLSFKYSTLHQHFEVAIQFTTGNWDLSFKAI